MKLLYTLASLSFATIVFSCGGGDPKSSEQDQEKPVSGASIFKTHCAICHGADGRKGLGGAKHLPESKLTLEERMAIIKYGKGTMMPYKDVLTAEERKAVAEYTLTLQ